MNKSIAKISIDLKKIKEIVSCTLNENASAICSSIFQDELILHHDEALEETYLICKSSGVSILYGDKDQFESLFFHFQGDEDTDDCHLDVFGFTAESTKADMNKLLVDKKILKEIKHDTNENSSVIFRIDSLICNAEFNGKDQLILLAIMLESS